MSLKKYMPCHPDHTNQFQYICLKEKKAFCLKCWFKLQHYRFCQSTRCGQYTKIAHTALNRALEYKNSKLLETFSASKQSYEQLRLRFLQLNYQVSEIVKQFVQQKMPLLFWSMSNQLIKSVGNFEEVIGYNKFDSTCTELIRIIKSNDTSQKAQFLQSAIGAYYDINHQIEGDLYIIKNSNFIHRNHKEDNINKVFESIKNNLKDILGNIKKGIRKTIDDELERATSAVDQTVKYKGVAFHKMQETQCFRRREEYPYINIISQEFGKITNEQVDLYNGFNLSLPQLESNPQQLLRLSKCLLKDRFFSIYEQINSVKSSFSYKYAYPISTTLSNDEQYESLIVNIQKSMLQQSSDNKNGSFICSLNLVIIGKELIIIKFYNLPKFCYSRKIYNYRKERTKYYDQLIDIFGLKNVQNRININPDFIQFTEDLTDTELVYSHFQTAYETLFLSNGQQLVFEGQRVMANKGAQLLAETIQKWKLTSQVDLKFNRPIKDIIGYFV